MAEQPELKQIGYISKEDLDDYGTVHPHRPFPFDIGGGKAVDAIDCPFVPCVPVFIIDSGTTEGAEE